MAGPPPAEPAGSPSDRDRLDWLRLARTDRIGPVIFRRLLETYGSAAHALERVPELARRGGGKPLTPYPLKQAERELAALADRGGRLLTLADPAYPAALAAVDDAPPVLSLLGDPQSLNRRAVAIVGSRRGSVAGCRFARSLARDLGRAGLNVVSGLARGIDTAAHEGALDTGTVAVVAGGLDRIYPPENADLFARIAETGAVVTEQALGRAPERRLFPRRNRIIAGLSHGVVVVEATMRSGSLITARLAGEQGRDVFAVPGFPSDPRHHGTNRLIRDGAVLTESAGDVLAALSVFGEPRQPVRKDFAETETAPAEAPDAVEDATRKIVLEALGPAPVSVDELIRQCQVTPASLMTVLLELELAGRLSRLAGGEVSLIT